MRIRERPSGQKTPAQDGELPVALYGSDDHGGAQPSNQLSNDRGLQRRTSADFDGPPVAAHLADAKA
jgi:hypothetical protein